MNRIAGAVLLPPFFHHVQRALEEDERSCLTCFRYRLLAGATRARCEVNKRVRREGIPLRTKHDVRYMRSEYRRRAATCEHWEGEE